LKKVKSKPKFFTTALLIIIFGILLSTAEGFSQNHFIINNSGGGSGTTSPPVDNSSDNTTLYVLGALVVGGIIVYALLKRNKDKSDSTDTKDKSSLLIKNNKFASFSTKLQRAKDDIPVDIILGVKNERAFISEKTYLLGVSIKF